MIFSLVFVWGFAFKIDAFWCTLVIWFRFRSAATTRVPLSSFFQVCNSLLDGLSVQNANSNSKIGVISFSLSGIVSRSVIVSTWFCTLIRKLGLASCRCVSKRCVRAAKIVQHFRRCVKRQVGADGLNSFSLD